MLKYPLVLASLVLLPAHGRSQAAVQQPVSAQQQMVLMPASLALRLLRAAHQHVEEAQAALDRETALYEELYRQVQQDARPVPQGAGNTAEPPLPVPPAPGGQPPGKK